MAKKFIISFFADSKSVYFAILRHPHCKVEELRLFILALCLCRKELEKTGALHLASSQ